MGVCARGVALQSYAFFFARFQEQLPFVSRSTCRRRQQFPACKHAGTARGFTRVLKKRISLCVPKPLVALLVVFNVLIRSTENIFFGFFRGQKGHTNVPLPACELVCKVGRENPGGRPTHNFL